MWLPLQDIFLILTTAAEVLNKNSCKAFLYNVFSTFFLRKFFLASFINWNWAFSKAAAVQKKQSGNHILCCDWRESWRKLLKIFYFPFFVLLPFSRELLQIFLRRFFFLLLFLLTIGDFCLELRYKFLSFRPHHHHHPSLHHHIHGRKKSKQTAIFLCVYYFNSFHFFFDTIPSSPSSSIPCSLIIIL